MVGSPGVKEGSFDQLGGMMEFQSMLVFANVFVMSQMWILFERNLCGIGLLQNRWRCAVGHL
jgi:hypothetical protein